MNRYERSPEYYPDDKDVFDFLSSSGAPLVGMLSFLSADGIFCSNRNRKEDIQKFVALTYLSWPRALRLLDLVDLREVDEQSTFEDLPISTDFVTVQSAIESLKKHRSLNNREVYELRFKENEIEILVKYVEVDRSKTRILQKRERDLTIVIRHRSDSIALRYHNNPIASQIVYAFRGFLAEIEKDKAELLKRPLLVDMRLFPTVEHRIKFFRTTMCGIPGYTFKDVVHLKVARIPKRSAMISATKQQNEENETERANETVSRIIMYGTSLFQAKEFQDIIQKGFYISGGSWRCEIDNETPDQIEFTAGFADKEEASTFTYKVAGKYVSIDGVISQTRERINPASGKIHSDNFEEHVRGCFREVLSEANKATQP